MKTRGKKLLALLLTLAMCLSLLPMGAMAAGETYQKITSADELTTGKYVMVVDSGYAPSVYSSDWLTAVQVNSSSDTLIDPASNIIWNITVESTGVKLTDSAGTTIAPKSGSNNGIEARDYIWTASCEEGLFTFAGQATDTSMLASNKSASNKFRAYKNATAVTYPHKFSLYKLDDGGTPPVTDKVATPVASPKGGSVATGTTVTLSCATDGA